MSLPFPSPSRTLFTCRLLERWLWSPPRFSLTLWAAFLVNAQGYISRTAVIDYVDLVSAHIWLQPWFLRYLVGRVVNSGTSTSLFTRAANCSRQRVPGASLRFYCWCFPGPWFSHLPSVHRGGIGRYVFPLGSSRSVRFSLTRSCTVTHFPPPGPRPLSHLCWPHHSAFPFYTLVSGGESSL